jgi:hypothetical protein
MDDHQEDIEKLNAGFQDWESDYTDQERSMGFEVLSVHLHWFALHG